MVIIACPKCGGCGEVWVDYGPDSSAARHKTTCNSCGGKGYITDYVVLDNTRIKVIPNIHQMR